MSANGPIHFHSDLPYRLIDLPTEKPSKKQLNTYFDELGLILTQIGKELGNRTAAELHEDIEILHKIRIGFPKACPSKLEKRREEIYHTFRCTKEAVHSAFAARQQVLADAFNSVFKERGREDQDGLLKEIEECITCLMDDNEELTGTTEVHFELFLLWLTLAERGLCGEMPRMQLQKQLVHFVKDGALCFPESVAAKLTDAHRSLLDPLLPSSIR